MAGKGASMSVVLLVHARCRGKRFEGCFVSWLNCSTSVLPPTFVCVGCWQIDMCSRFVIAEVVFRSGDCAA